MRLVVTLTSTQSFETQFVNHLLEFAIMQEKEILIITDLLIPA